MKVVEAGRSWVRRRPGTAIFAVALGLRLIAGVVVGTVLHGSLVLDDSTYSQMAAQAASHNTARWDAFTHFLYGETASFLVPLTVLYRVFGAHQFVGQVFVALFGALTAVFVYATARCAGFPGVWAPAAGLLVACFPSQVLFSSTTLKDALVWAGLSLLAFLLARAARSPRAGWMALGGALAVTAFLRWLRPYVCVVVLCSLAVWAISWSLTSFRRWPRRCLAAIGWLVLLVLWPMALGAGPAAEGLFPRPGQLSSYRSAQDYGGSAIYRTPAKPPPSGGPSASSGASGGTRVRATGSASAPTEASRSGFSQLGTGLVATVLEPYPGQGGLTAKALLPQVEDLLWYPIVLLALIGVVSTIVFSEWLLFPTLTVGGIVLADALTEGNLGTAYRHRGEVFWGAALLALAGLWLVLRGPRAVTPPVPASSGSRPLVCLVSHWDWVLYHYRLELASALEAKGYRVLLVCPRGKYTGELARRFEWREWPIARRSLNPLREIVSLLRLHALFRRLAPRVVHNFTLKPIIYGSIAGWAAGADAIINNFSGLGYVFSDEAPRAITLPTVAALRRIAKRRAVWSVAQTEADISRLEASGAVRRDRYLVVPGTGVDTSEFRPALPAPADQVPIVLVASRLLVDKGIHELVQAAQMVRQAGLTSRFLVAGEPDLGNPKSLDPETIVHWQEQGPVEWLGHRPDIAELLRGSDIACLPTYYPEGIPLFLLEAAASGLPIVATDTPGCRAVVEPGINGYLVAPKDSIALADALKSLIRDPDLRSRFGRAGRRKAIAEFELSRVTATLVNLYATLLPVDGATSREGGVDHCGATVGVK